MMMTIPPKIFFLLNVVVYLNLAVSNLIPDELQSVNNIEAVVVFILDVSGGS